LRRRRGKRPALAHLLAGRLEVVFRVGLTVSRQCRFAKAAESLGETGRSTTVVWFGGKLRREAAWRDRSVATGPAAE
jgi:hypothetical protein